MTTILGRSSPSPFVPHGRQPLTLYTKDRRLNRHRQLQENGFPRPKRDRGYTLGVSRKRQNDFDRQSGRDEVYIQPSEGDGGRLQISVEGDSGRLMVGNCSTSSARS
jgi:hypothetical protein